MDPSSSSSSSSSSSQTNDTISDTGGNGSSSPPSFIWVIIPLVVVLLTGGLIATLYRAIIRCRWRKTEGDAEQQTAGGLGSTTLEVDDATAWARGHNTRRDPASDTGTINRSSDRIPGRDRSAAQPAEGLNELGEAPPPYGEGEGEARPKSYMAEMGEVRGDAAGEGPSGPQQGTGGGQGRPPAGPEPPAYEESAVGGGPGGTSSLREPPAAVVISRPR